MAITNSVQFQEYNGSLLSLNLLSGMSQTLLLNALGAASATTVTENNNSLAVGETVILEDGRSATVLGSGTAQPGINVLGLIVPTGTKVPLVVLQEPDGNILFLYPAGAPNVLGTVALVVTASPKDYTFAGGITCLAEGTHILTPLGSIPVEHLKVGDHVVTEDGLFPILWVSQIELTETMLNHNPKLAPIRITAGALGPDLPRCDLIVSHQHRMLIRSHVAEQMTGSPAVLSAAKHLCGIPGIEADADIHNIRLFHILLDRHRIIFAEGAPTETFFPGPEGMRTLTAAARHEIRAQLGGEIDRLMPAYPILSGRMARTLLARHMQNGIPFVSQKPTACSLEQSRRTKSASDC